MMRGGFFFNLVVASFLLVSISNAQTDPGTENLIHQWTFDDGTPNDMVSDNPINGVLMGGASIENNALKLTSDGQYLSFSASSLAINNYPVITQEIWFTSIAGANSGYTMLSYFGGYSEMLGYNYVSTSAARGDDKSRTAISDGTYDSEISADGPELDDGLLHHMVSVISPDSVILYLDGEYVSGAKNTIPLSSISNSLAFLGKGGYSGDATWIGSISMFSLYDRALSAGEVRYLFYKGSERSPLITSSVSSIAFDEFISMTSLNISGYNLSDSITLSAPEGITLSQEKLTASARYALVLLFHDGITPVDGFLEVSSPEYTLNIPVKTFTNDCFTPYYPGVPNLVPDPYISSLLGFTGWGERQINTDPEFNYCGASSGLIASSNSGSIDVSLTGKLQTNTQYRVRAKVLSRNGTFQIGVFGWSEGQGDYNHRITAADDWQDVDFTFTTGSQLGSSQGLFFNNYDLSGTWGYIDNWECYAVPRIYASPGNLEFITPGTKTLDIRAVNLNSDITLTVPDGFSVSQVTLPEDANTSLEISYDGINTAEGYLYFTSGDVKDSVLLKGSLEAVIIPSKELVLLDELDQSASLLISAYNLTEEIQLDPPEGITLSENTMPADASGRLLTLLYDGIGNSSGELVFSSGTYTTSLQIQAERNEACFIPLYADRENLIEDPTCNTFIDEGWGTRRINSDPTYVFCGARSAEINSGSLEHDLTGVLKANTSYRMKAQVYKKSPVKPGNMGNVTYTLALDSAFYPQAYQLISIAMDSACSYFSRYTPFIENIYVYYSSGIPTAQASYRGSIGFGPNTRYMWVGTAIHEMAHYFGSGTTSIWQGKMSGGSWSGSAGTSLMQSINGTGISGDSQHFWPYGINQKEEITNLGSLAIQHKALGDAVKIIKAMLVDDCDLPVNNPSVGIGVFGWNAGSEDLYEEVLLANTWEEIDFTFKTGENMASSQGVFLNSGTGYIDNWELYELSSNTFLSTLTIDGMMVGNFDPLSSVYNFELEKGETLIPLVEAETADPLSTITISEADNLPGTTTVKVTAEDGSTNTYTVNFIYKPSDDATLLEIYIDGVLLEDFDGLTTSITIELPYGTTDIPVVTAIPNDENASILITPTDSLPGTTRVILTAEDGISTRVYEINFDLETSIDELLSEAGIKLYPTVSDGSFHIEARAEKMEIKVFNLSGSLIWNDKIPDCKYEVFIPYPGSYFIQVSTSRESAVFKVLILE